MTSLHELPEATKRSLDFAASLSAVTAIGLSQAALIVSIIAGLLSIAWYSIRIVDRIKNGPSDD